MFCEECNAKINRLKREGGVGYPEKKVLTYDANTVGKEYFQKDNYFYYKIGDAIDPMAITKACLKNIDKDLVASPEDLEIELVNNSYYCISGKGIGIICAIVVLADNTTIDSISGISAGTYVLDEMGYFYVSYIETETIHPISDKYLPEGFGGGGAVYLEIPQVAWNGLLAGGTIPLDMATAEQIEKAGNENIPLYVWTNYTEGSETVRQSIRFDCSLAGVVDGGTMMAFSGQMFDFGSAEVLCLGAIYSRYGSDITLLVQKFAPTRKT